MLQQLNYRKQDGLYRKFGGSEVPARKSPHTTTMVATAIETNVTKKEERKSTKVPEPFNKNLQQKP